MRGLILGFELQEESTLALKAETWAEDNRPWVEAVKWGQWEGLRRQGEDALGWQDYRNALDHWLTDHEKIGNPPRRAWNQAGFSVGGLGLRDALLRVTEEASAAPKTEKLQLLDSILEDAQFSGSEQAEIRDVLRVRRGRKFVELLALKIKTIKEEKHVQL